MSTSEVDLTESRGTEVHVIGWVFTGIAIITVALKLFARAQIVKRIGWDDFFIFFSLALSIIATAFVSYSVTLGLGRHTAAIIAEHGTARLVDTAKWQILGYPFNIGAFSFPNISIAILVNNLLDPNPLRTRCLYALVILQVVFAMASVFIIFLQCTPTEALWNSAVAGKCWDADIFNDFSYWVSAYTTMTDIILAIVPISVFWKLQMRFSTKLGVCIMMGLTLLSAIVTIVKATYLHLFTDRTDPLWNVVPLVLWGLIEQNVVIVAACIPTLRPFFHKAFGSTNKSNLSGSESHTRSGSAFKLTSNPGNSSRIGGSKIQRTGSVSEQPLDETKVKGYDAESNNSRQGIWRTREISVESDEDVESGMGRKLRDRIPASLRTTA